MKKLISVILGILLLSAAIPAAVNAGGTDIFDGYDFKGEVGALKVTRLASADGITLDGVIDNEGEAWGSAPVCRVDGSNATLSWSYRSKINGIIDIEFVCTADGLYAAASVVDPYVVLSDGANDIHNYDGDYRGEADCFGYNGDLLILELDPCNYLDSDPVLRNAQGVFLTVTPWSDGTLRVFDGHTRNTDVTALVEGAYTLTDEGWDCELYIPWSLVADDVAAITSGAFAPTAAQLGADGAAHDAMVMYLDRYVYGSGNVGAEGEDALCFDPQLKIYDKYNPEIDGTFHPKIGTTYTVSRWGTCCSFYEEGGEQKAGIFADADSAKVYGVRLNVSGTACTPGAREQLSAASCTQRGISVVRCSDCGEILRIEDSGYAHSLSGAQIITPATCTIGVRASKCDLCGGYFRRGLIPAVGTHAGDGAPAIRVSARIDAATGKRELYCETCGETVKSTKDTIHILFADVTAGAWYCEGISYAVNNSLFAGTSQRKFTPGGTMTREMFVTVLAAAAEADLSGYTGSHFSDVAEDKWYSAAVEWAYQNEITKGVADGVFGTGQPVSREQLALFMMQYAARRGTDTSAHADLSAYPDAQSVHGWARDGMSWACASGLVSGTGAGLLAPRDSSTRASAALMTMRLLSL